MAGVDKVILRGCAVWLIGVQREANEIKRNLSNIPADIKRPKPVDITALERGQFFACFGKETIKTYVQPSWMAIVDAKSIALGSISIGEARRPDPIAEKRKEPTVTETEARK